MMCLFYYEVMIMFKLRMLLGILPNIKGWLWADGKFSPPRALVLLAAGTGLGVSIYFLGAANTATLVELLDEVSDIVGFE